jgi:hypothetical protein
MQLIGEPDIHAWAVRFIALLLADFMFRSRSVVEEIAGMGCSL